MIRLILISLAGVRLRSKATHTVSRFLASVLLPRLRSNHLFLRKTNLFVSRV